MRSLRNLYDRLFPARYAVVTAIPDHMRNYADREAVVDKEAVWNVAYCDVLHEMSFGNPPIDLAGAIRVRVPVWQVGELLILDRNGREVCGRGRKPSKWDLRLRRFRTLRGALRLIDHWHHTGRWPVGT